MGSASSSAPAPCAGGAGDVNRRAPHELGGPPVDYRIVIPTRGRWRPACEISPSERALKRDRRPFVLVKTLALLKRHKIHPAKVTLYVSDEEELSKYKAALKQDQYWEGAGFEVGRPGILNQRNFIVDSLPEGSYVVSLDDDLSEINWKHKSGSLELQPLPNEGLERVFFHAHSLLLKHKAFIWGLNTTSSKNPRNMWSDGVSTRNGEINGFCYGFINRRLRALQPQVVDATEDAERSLRFFRQDKIILRYRMYAGETRCFGFEQGLQAQFEGISLEEKNKARKAAERDAASRLQDLFPEQMLRSKEKKGIQTLEIRFRSIGGLVIPMTSLEALKDANDKDQASRNGPSSKAADGGEKGGGPPRKRKAVNAAGPVALRKLPRSASASTTGTPLQERRLPLAGSDGDEEGQQQKNRRKGEVTVSWWNWWS
jgi:hypothetical protein